MTKYYSRHGGEQINGLPVQLVGETLERIRREHGGQLRPEDIVQEAADPNHPLHPAFTWDDSVAGHKHRLWEARMLVRSVVIVVEREEERVMVPFFVHVPPPDGAEGAEGPYYQSATVLVRREDEFYRALGHLRAKADALIKSCDSLRALAAHQNRRQLVAATIAARRHFEAGARRLQIKGA